MNANTNPNPAQMNQTGYKYPKSYIEFAKAEMQNNPNEVYRRAKQNYDMLLKQFALEVIEVSKLPLPR